MIEGTNSKESDHFIYGVHPDIALSDERIISDSDLIENINKRTLFLLACLIYC